MPGARRRPRPEALEKFELARQLTAQGRRDQAIDAYLGALGAEPDFAEALVNLGILYIRLGEPHIAEGVRCLRRGVALKPGGVRAQYNLGVALLELPNGVEDAIAAFHAVLAIDPEHPSSLYALSVAYSRLGNVAQAQELHARYQRATAHAAESPRRSLSSLPGATPTSPAESPTGAPAGATEEALAVVAGATGPAAVPLRGVATAPPDEASARGAEAPSAVSTPPRERWLEPASAEPADESVDGDEDAGRTAPVLRVRFRLA